jgi:hypothetical protein
MTFEIDVEEILRRNPQIDRQQFEDAQRNFAKTCNYTMLRKEYDLAPSYGGKKISASHDLSETSVSSSQKSTEN